MNTTPRRKLVEVSLPLEAINDASGREKSLRQGLPSTMHLWWSRKPLATARAILFAQLVDDPSSHPDRFPSREAQDDERQRLHKLIEQLVVWENTTNTRLLDEARAEIRNSNGGELPSILDPFAGDCIEFGREPVNPSKSAHTNSTGTTTACSRHNRPTVANPQAMTIQREPPGSPVLSQAATANVIATAANKVSRPDVTG